eukprot:TRINITY_DN2852_c0_g1_i2.p1 TRINITY_DN2852_c0_g1~~TRINITY_DN2852_c0_g1_i2.p1  ORF type:complete len:118 (-),score=24.77 TRINITY_DN2852_c0_g1_i2:269-622(-)
MASWSTGLFDCCGSTPDGTGGPLLCLRATCCLCTVTGDINKAIGGPGGFIGGCTKGCFCANGYVACLAMQVAKEADVEESGNKVLCGSLCCPGCYAIQVYKEIKIKHIGTPGQEEMK